MPNIIDANGLQTKTQAELVAEFTTAFETIYGSDINLGSDTPDGQMMMIFIQSILDCLDLLTQIYNSMNPDNAVGVILDQRVSFNGIQRQAGTYTVTNITIVLSASVTLKGVDSYDEDEAFTVSDDAGNEFVLLSTFSDSAGTVVKAFRSKVAGEVLTTPNTITTAVSIILGVTSVNNPTTYTTLGINEESDQELKLRRLRSVALASQGFLEGLVAALENITGIASVQVYENVTGSTDGDGIPSHSIWVIVSGTYDDVDVATAIYQKRNAGCGMKGDNTYVITQVDGSPFTIRWDDVESEDLFIKFTVASLDGVNDPDYEAIRTDLVESFVPGVYEQVNVNDLATEVQVIDDNALVTSPGFSDSAGGSYTNTKTPSAKNKQFAVSSPNIIILPILVLPSAPSIGSSESIDFVAYGGYGSYTWTLETDATGASINGSTGEYVAGAGTGTDVIRATDGLGNYTDVSITVS